MEEMSNNLNHQTSSYINNLSTIHSLNSYPVILSYQNLIISRLLSKFSVPWQILFLSIWWKLMQNILLSFIKKITQSVESVTQESKLNSHKPIIHYLSGLHILRHKFVLPFIYWCNLFNLLSSVFHQPTSHFSIRFLCSN